MRGVEKGDLGAVSLLLVAGLVVLAFAGLTYAGAYLQWSDAVRTTAAIDGAEQERIRRGSGNLELAIRYEVDGQELRGEVSVSPKRLEGKDLAEGIEVYYMKRKPSRVTPVEVLEDKRDNIPFMVGLGALLFVGGIVAQVRSRGGR